MTTKEKSYQSLPAEILWKEELDWLELYDQNPKPPGWRLSPATVVTFIIGTDEPLRMPKGKKLPSGTNATLRVTPKYVGNRSLIERCTVTLAGERGLMLVGEPGTAKSMLSELFAAAISGTSSFTIQGTAGVPEEAFRYGWNYSMLLGKGPVPEALVPSPVLSAMRQGAIVRVEEITRCMPEIQDMLISILSERVIAIPELEIMERALQGFSVIATANLRDRGVNEMSAALKRRFNFETVPPIADAALELDLVKRQTRNLLDRSGFDIPLDEEITQAIVTAFRDLRTGLSAEGWTVDKPSTVMSTAEAVSVSVSMALEKAFFPSKDIHSAFPGYLLGTVEKDEPADRGKLLAYWDGPVARRGKNDDPVWKKLHDLKDVLK
ncbi:AAA family ATPase [Myxococcota bacterium]|nr:AAA family ATPase [Myxococcota bacterium]MBU1498297.1 AAA family ATPase [Myxococcota bacterium]